MGDRSEEATTSEPRSTDELLEETDQLLSESGGFDAGSGAGGVESSGSDLGQDREAGESGSWWRSGDSTTATETEPKSTSSSSRWSRLKPSWPSVGPSSYFSPKAFLGLLLALSIGFMAGGSVIPIAGSLIGVLTVAFLIGLLTSKRRYLEVALAGGAVSGVAALFENMMLAMVSGASSQIALIGVTAGIVGSLIGYYFGRDLKAGLTREIE